MGHAWRPLGELELHDPVDVVQGNTLKYKGGLPSLIFSEGVFLIKYRKMLNSLIGLLASAALPALAQNVSTSSNSTLSPQVMIISMFAPEQNVWLAPYNLTTNYTVMGLSPKFPQIHCNSNGTICQVTTDEGTANAAASIMATTLSSKFNLTQTYFMVAGIAGVKPEVASIGSATFARYAVDIDLIHAVVDTEKPANFSSSFWGQGTYAPGIKPKDLYGSEIFELNSTLRSAAANLAVTMANISSIDTPDLSAFRMMYNTTNYTR